MLYLPTLSSNQISIQIVHVSVYIIGLEVRIVVFNATFNNISGLHYKIKDTSNKLHMVDSFIFKLYLKLLRNQIHNSRHTPVTYFINKSTVVMCLQPSKLEFGVEGRVTTTFTLSLSILNNSSGDNDYVYMKELPLA